MLNHADRHRITGWMMIRRGIRLASALSRHGFGWLLERLHLGWLVPFHRGLFGYPRQPQRYTAPDHIRMALECLGPTFIKLGQILSSRGDVLPDAYRLALSKLHDQARPEPPGTVEGVIESELGRPLQDVFEWFDPEALAAASIGQAHAARLADGTAVVVKVRRPAAVAQVEVDLALLEAIARAATRRMAVARRHDIAGLVAELARTLRAELDYRVEAANATRFATNLTADATVHIPLVHADASTERIITLERITGIKVSDLAALDAAGIDRPALAQHIVDVVLTMVFEHGFFHADPHPGNLFVEPDGRLALVDFGMVGTVDPPTQSRLIRAFIATAAGDAPTLTAELLGLGIHTAPVDRDRLTRDLAGLLSDVTNVPLGDVRLGPLLQSELAIIRRHHLRLPAELAQLVKVAAMTEGLATQLDPGFVLAVSFGPYAARLLQASEAPSDHSIGDRPAAPADPPPLPRQRTH